MQKKDKTEFFFIAFANNGLPDHGGVLAPRYHVRRLADRSRVSEAQIKLRSLLSQIINNQALLETEELLYFTTVVEQSAYKFEVKNEKLSKDWVYAQGEEELLSHPIWLRSLADDLTTYLLNPKNNLKKIKKCRFCNQFFLAKNIKRQNGCYSIECVREYEKIKKRKQRDDNPSKYL